MKIWIRITGAEGRYGLPGYPDAFWFGEGAVGFPKAVGQAAEELGLKRLIDRAGYPARRTAIPVAEIEAAGEPS